MSELYRFNPFFEYSTPEPILREAFAWETNGIFAAIENAANSSGIELPWESGDAETLDMAYFGNHSGSKFCSPVVKLCLQTTTMVDENGKLNQTATAKLANILLRKYYTNWTALWRTNITSYNPIHNYDMNEERDLSTTADNVETTDGTKTKTGTDTLAHGLSQTTAHGRTTQSMDYKYGINTDISDPKPSDKGTTSEGGNTTTTDSGSDIRTYNLSDDDDTTVTQDNEGTEHEEIHRYGNIGVTTTQQMLEAERKLWLWNYFDQIFEDLDRELALAFHDPCRV